MHRLLGTMIGLCGDELLWKVHKSVFLRLVCLFSLFIDNIRCGYARFKGAAHTFPEHQKNRKRIDNSLRKLNLVRDLEKIS